MHANLCFYVALSEVVDLLVGVEVGGLEQHLCGVASILILVHHVDTGIQVFHVDLLGANLAVLNLLLLHLVLLLEVALGLQVTVGAHALEAIVLGDEARGVRAGLVVQEGVGMRRFRAEPRRGNKFYRNYGEISECGW